MNNQLPTSTPDVVYVYDGTFDGFLTVVFEAYESKRQPMQIVRESRWEPGLFDIGIRIKTDRSKSERVWKGIVARSSAFMSRIFYVSFASELPNIETDMYWYLTKLFADKTGQYYKNLLDDHSFTLYKTARKVGLEVQRFRGYVRFQETADGLFFAAIDPDHDIVSLLAPHFARRFRNQLWVIYDSKRDKGIYYDTKELQEITLTDKQFDTLTGEVNQQIEAEDEDQYRKLWKAYYKAVNIPERKNTRLMLSFLPRRYWKYLPEKKG